MRAPSKSATVRVLTPWKLANVEGRAVFRTHSISYNECITLHSFQICAAKAKWARVFLFIGEGDLVRSWKHLSIGMVETLGTHDKGSHLWLCHKGFLRIKEYSFYKHKASFPHPGKIWCFTWNWILSFPCSKGFLHNMVPFSHLFT